MRADRLVSVLLLLQARGKVTTAEVAEALEVSERTARRDLDGLSMAGIPVYSRQGRGGGWSLIGGASTDLTGFRSAEARALLTMAAAAGQATPEFATAMAKLVQALPETMREDARRISASTLSDDARWGDAEASSNDEPRRDEFLEPLQHAILERRRIALTYDTPRKGVSQRWAEPLGLVVKRSAWYLLARTEAGQRSFRVDRVVAIDLLDDVFETPADFDLETAWNEITLGYTAHHRRFAVDALAEPWTLGPLRAMGVEVVRPETVSEHDDADGNPGSGSGDRVRVRLGALTADVLAAVVAGVMHGIELLGPPGDKLTVESRLAEIGAGLIERFAAPTGR